MHRIKVLFVVLGVTTALAFADQSAIAAKTPKRTTTKKKAAVTSNKAAKPTAQISNSVVSGVPISVLSFALCLPRDRENATGALERLDAWQPVLAISIAIDSQHLATLKSIGGIETIVGTPSQVAGTSRQQAIVHRWGVASYDSPRTRAEYEANTSAGLYDQGPAVFTFDKDDLDIPSSSPNVVLAARSVQEHYAAAPQSPTGFADATGAAERASRKQFLPAKSFDLPTTQDCTPWFTNARAKRNPWTMIESPADTGAVQRFLADKRRWALEMLDAGLLEPTYCCKGFPAGATTSGQS